MTTKRFRGCPGLRNWIFFLAKTFCCDSTVNSQKGFFGQKLAINPQIFENYQDTYFGYYLFISPYQLPTAFFPKFRKITENKIRMAFLAVVKVYFDGQHAQVHHNYCSSMFCFKCPKHRFKLVLQLQSQGLKQIGVLKTGILSRFS